MSSTVSGTDVRAALHAAGIDPDVITAAPGGHGVTVFAVALADGGRICVGLDPGPDDPGPDRDGAVPWWDWTRYTTDDEIAGTSGGDDLATVAADIADAVRQADHAARPAAGPVR